MKNGDKVRIIKSSSVNKVGDVGVIKGDSKGVFQVNVAGRSQDRNWHTASEVKLVEETKTYTPEEVNGLIDDAIDSVTNHLKDYYQDNDKFVQEFKKDKGLIPSLDVGKWYWCRNREQLSLWNNGSMTYGFLRGSWDSWACINTDRIEATNEEILKALTAEAIKRGHNYNEYRIYPLGIFQGVNTYDNLWTNLMEDGKWETVVNTEEDELKKALQAAQDALENYSYNKQETEYIAKINWEA